MILDPALLPPRDRPLVIAWSAPNKALELLEFASAAEWTKFVRSLSIDPAIPHVTGAKFARAQKLTWLAWMGDELLIAGELAALVALELAVRDRFGGAEGKRKPTFAELLRRFASRAPLELLPPSARHAGDVRPLLMGEIAPSLSQRRNALAHGDPFDGQPTAGLLELVRDLILLAYRDYLLELRGGSP